MQSILYTVLISCLRLSIVSVLSFSVEGVSIYPLLYASINCLLLLSRDVIPSTCTMSKQADLYKSFLSQGSRLRPIIACKLLLPLHTHSLSCLSRPTMATCIDGTLLVKFLYCATETAISLEVSRPRCLRKGITSSLIPPSVKTSTVLLVNKTRLISGI